MLTTYPTYCDGSRNHGCEGCFCRKLSTTKEHGICDICGKKIYHLLDAMWRLRKKMLFPKVRSVPLYFSTSDLIYMEYTVDMAVHENVKKFNVGMLKRTELFEVYLQATEVVTAEIIRAAYIIRERNFIGFSSYKESVLHPESAWWFNDPDYCLKMSNILRQFNPKPN